VDRVELAEGRTRQIREMFFRIGHPVQKLLRELTDREMRTLRRVTARERAPAAGRVQPQPPRARRAPSR
jgi:16S rRNA U516 pseudouridylate synthase RsuA-like enzyme